MLRKAEPRMHPAFKHVEESMRFLPNKISLSFKVVKPHQQKIIWGAPSPRRLEGAPCQDDRVIKGISFMSAFYHTIVFFFSTIFTLFSTPPKYHSELLICVKDPQLSTSTVLQQLYSGDFCSNSQVVWSLSLILVAASLQTSPKPNYILNFIVLNSKSLESTAVTASMNQ